MNQLNMSEIHQEGLIHTLESVPTSLMDNQFHRYMAIIKQKSGQKIFPGTGFSMDYHVARSHAVGEAIERYCAGIMNPLDIVVQPSGDLDYPCVPPLHFNRYTDGQYRNQYKFEPHNENDVRNWVLANNYITGEQVYLPIETVYLLIPNQYKKFRDVISTGLASGPSFEAAFENALNECVEKDSFMLFWLLKRVNFEIAVNSLKATHLNKLIQSMESFNYSIQIYDISQPEIKSFTILTVMKAKDSKGFYMATSTNRKLSKAIKKSIEEAVSGYVTLQEKSAYQSTSNLDMTKEDTAFYYFNGLDDEVLTEVIDPKIEVKYLESVDLEYKYSEMIQSVQKQTDIYYKDLTTNDIKELNLVSLRVVTPGLLILPYEREALLESKRLMKYSNGEPLNAKPHPFP